MSWEDVSERYMALEFRKSTINGPTILTLTIVDANNKPIVIDVPNPNASPPRNYGTFNECMSQKNAPVSTVRQAECLTMLAAGKSASIDGYE
jgi:hypothetical protein